MPLPAIFSISFDNVIPDLQDVRLHDKDFQLQPDVTSLRYLSVVDTALVPLCLTIGPPFRVTTSSDPTETFFSSILTRPDDDNEESWWRNARKDSPLGVLVEIIRAGDCAHGSPYTSTELLFYAAKHDRRPITPPQSSSNGDDVHTNCADSLALYALPLNSRLLALPSGPTPPTSLSDQGCSIISPVFLSRPASPAPHNHPTETATASTRAYVSYPPVRKRSSATSTLDEAEARRRKARRKGGAGVFSAAAAVASSRFENGALPLKHRRTDGQSVDIQMARPLSRSASVASSEALRRSVPTSTRPHSPLNTSTSITATAESPVATANKSVISRIVLAGLRLRGISAPPKNQSQREQDKASLPEDDDVNSNDEYKLLYHQVFRATLCTFRRQQTCGVPLVSCTEAVREVVERLLGIFCSDPLQWVPEVDGMLSGPVRTCDARGTDGGSSKEAGSVSGETNGGSGFAAKGKT